MSNELRKYGSPSVVQTSNIGFTSEVSDYLVVHTGPDDLNTLHWPRGKTPLSCFRVVRVLPLILCMSIVFDIVLCHYLLLYIRIVLVFLLILYTAFVIKLYHYLL